MSVSKNNRKGKLFERMGCKAYVLFSGEGGWIAEAIRPIKE